MSILASGGDKPHSSFPSPYPRSVAGANQLTALAPPIPHAPPSCLSSAPPTAGMPLPYLKAPIIDSNEPITGRDVLEAPAPQSIEPQTNSAYMPFLDPSRRDKFYRRYLELSERVAQKYPNAGPPVERQGRAGASWRHIKEVQGHNNRVLYVDGIVRLYDRDYVPTVSSARQPLGLARQTPGGALRPLHREYTQTNCARPINATTTFLPGEPAKYKGFYNYK